MLCDYTEPPSAPETKELVHRVRENRHRVRENRLDLLYSCNANSHHVICGGTNNSEREESLHGFIISEELLLLHRVMKPTSMVSRRQEILDKTMSTVGLVNTGEFLNNLRVR